MPIVHSDDTELILERSNWWVHFLVALSLAAGLVGILVGALVLHEFKQIVVIAVGAVFLVIGVIFTHKAVSARFVIRRGLTHLTLREEWTYPFGCCRCACCWYSTRAWNLDRDGRVPIVQGARGGADADVYITCADQAATRVNVTGDEGFLFGACSPDKAIIANDISAWIRTYGRGGSSSGDRRRSGSQKKAQAASISIHDEA